MAPPPLTQRLGASLWWLEDDRELCRLLESRLRACGWRLALYHRVPDLRAALMHDEPDLLLLDRRLSGGNGLDLLEQLRGENHHFPVLILSGLASADHRVEGLAAGANDYLAKPFCFPELMWRIERLLQSAPPRPIQVSQPLLIPIGPLTLDPADGRLRSGAPSHPDAGAVAGGAHGQVRLSRGDRALLLALLQAPGAVLSRQQLARASGSLVDVATSRSLDVRLSRLRRLLRRLSAGAVSIEAVRGLGYRLCLPPAADRPAPASP
ncbi:MAG: response regulator transcription factor [Cyanobacteriota bacterium]|nr:response regulator transcription factor [Cyanobacteriota bacterium]